MEALESNSTVRQWVSAVTDYSSEYGRTSYYHAGLVGGPTVYPNYRDATTAAVVRHYGPWWLVCPSAPKPISPKRLTEKATFQVFGDRYGARNFLNVEYKQAVFPQEISIYETFNCGSVVRILAKPSNYVSGRGMWVELWSGPTTIDQCEPGISRIFKPTLNLKNAKFLTRELRIEIDSIDLEYYCEFDAIELVGTFDVEEPTQHVSRADQAILESNIELFERISVTRSTSGDPEEDADNFDILPDEILISIFSMIEITDLFRISCVSRRFYWASRQVLHSLKGLDLQPYYNGIDDDVLFYLGPQLRHLQALSLSWSGHSSGTHLTSGGFVNLISNLPNLKILRVACCWFITDECIQSLAIHCPGLEELDVSRCQRIGDDGFSALKKLTQLKVLRMYLVKPSIRARVEILPRIPEHCTNLEHINAGVIFSENDGVPFLRSVAANCPNLVSLDFWHNRHIYVDSLMALSAGCPKLRELDIGWCRYDISPSDFAEFIQGFPLLEKLFLTCNSVTTARLDTIRQYCPNLKQLDILGGHTIDAGSITRVLLECTELEFFDISFTNSGVDLDELRATFPKCSIKSSIS